MSTDDKASQLDEEELLKEMQHLCPDIDGIEFGTEEAVLVYSFFVSV